MFCGVCGKESIAENKFCTGCGKPLAALAHAPNGRYSVILQSLPPDEFERFRVIRQLAGVMKLSEQELAARMKNTPSTIASVESLAEAEGLQQALEPLGVTVSVTPPRRDRVASVDGNGTHVQNNPTDIDKLNLNVLANGTRDTNTVVGQVPEKTAQAIGGVVLAVLIFFGGSWLVRGCGSVSGGNVSSQHLITFETLRQWGIPAGGIGMEILVAETATKEQVLALAKQLHDKYLSTGAMFILIFDSKEAYLSREAVLRGEESSYPEEEYDKHFLVNITRNANTGYDKILWQAQGRDH